MNAHHNAGASRAAIGEALPARILNRLVVDLFDDNDRLVDRLDRTAAERDAAIEVGNTNARSGASWAAEYESAVATVERLTERVATEKAMKGEFRRQRDEALNEGDRLKDALAAVVMLAQDAPHGIADSHFERIITVAEGHLPRAALVDETDAYPNEQAPVPITLGADVQAEGVAFSLPPGFIEIDPASLPAEIVEAVRARTGPDARFFEVDANEIPRDLFRAIYGLDRHPEQPAALHECPTPEPCACSAEPKFTEAENFILEAAEQYGFTADAFEPTLYTATERQVISLVTAAREQGRRDTFFGPDDEKGHALGRQIVDTLARIDWTDRKRAAKVVADVMKRAIKARGA